MTQPILPPGFELVTPPTRPAADVLMLKAQLNRVLRKYTERQLPPGVHTLLSGYCEACQWFLGEDTPGIKQLQSIVEAL